jgi:hypothetical protein
MTNANFFIFVMNIVKIILYSLPLKGRESGSFAISVYLANY